MRSHTSRNARAAMLSVVMLAAVMLAACRSPAATSIPAAPALPPMRLQYASGEDLLGSMRARYEGKWYQTLTFRQKTSRLLPNGTWNVQTWYEASKLPGRLRIDVDPVSAGNGVLYARDSQYVVNNGRVLQRTAEINPLLLLGFDVYAAPTLRVAALLKKEGYDLARVHADTFAGRPAIVVGALRGDLKRKQFWIDAEHLYFVRQIESNPRDATKMQDVRFVNYERRGDAWLAPRVELFSDGKLVFYEDYSDIRTDVPLDDALFDPSKWKTVKHWMTP